MIPFNYRLWTFRNGYVEAMLWANTMEYRGEELTSVDATAFAEDLDPDLLKHVEETCKDFVDSFDEPTVVGETFHETKQEWLRFINCHANLPHAGKLFALSRNGHGAGFFDSGEGYPLLQEHAKAWGSETWLLTKMKRVELFG